jgi:hypothetical protein
MSLDDVDSVFFKYHLIKAESARLIIVCKRTFTRYITNCWARQLSLWSPADYRAAPESQSCGSIPARGSNKCRIKNSTRHFHLQFPSTISYIKWDAQNSKKSVTKQDFQLGKLVILYVGNLTAPSPPFQHFAKCSPLAMISVGVMIFILVSKVVLDFNAICGTCHKSLGYFIIFTYLPDSLV